MQQKLVNWLDEDIANRINGTNPTIGAGGNPKQLRDKPHYQQYLNQAQEKLHQPWNGARTKARFAS